MYSVRSKVVLTHSYHKLCFLLIPIFVVILTLTGCDRHREAREAMQLQISQQQQQLDSLNEHKQQLALEVSHYELKISDQQLALINLQQAQDEKEANLLAYLGRHKLATAALVSTGSAAVIMASDEVRNLVDNTTGQGSSNVAVGVGILGVGYCFINASECGEVAAMYAAYNTETENMDARKVGIESSIIQLQMSKDELILQMNNLDPRIKKLEIDISDSKQQLANLQDDSWFGISI
ncbi:hypothetical protein [Psychrobacter sp. I-STPA10]|uniref:hypothetical protein n=1 Tax=Psychrobacter sp. I-STPA10 TaxID=2585769 RepID=UPI001E5F1F40|nr:hypothetical protein [Psychrobacter sp. I-STPA10]